MERVFCKDCFYFSEETRENKTYTQCRIDPPKVFLDQNDSFVTSFPRVYPNGWCGQWEVKEDHREILRELADPSTRYN